MAPRATLVLDGYSKSDAMSIIACHVHFCGLKGPGASHIKTFVLPATKGTKGNATVTFKVPSGANAVCVTLVWRFKGGWLRHGRCRFSALANVWNLDQTKHMLFETTLMGNGTATLSFPDAPGMGFRGPTEPDLDLIREWFHVPETSRRALAGFIGQCMWYEDKQPIDERIRRVHMPYWNNKSDSLPGWFFSFEHSSTPRYDHTDFIDVFAAAKTGILGIETLSTPAEQSLVLAWGLCLFGLSIQYQPDTFSVNNTPVERFSSNARLDGIGDCEDIAKEICMTHADLCGLSDMKENFSYDMVQIKTRARQYKCVIMLGTVARYSSPDKSLAHAFAMLVPKWFFGETHPHVEGENAKAKDKRQQAMEKEKRMCPCPLLCDGTYPSYPVMHDDWKRPWRHLHIVSALIMNEGEIYFTDIDEPGTYGIAFDDFFPVIQDNVGFAFTHNPLSDEDVGHVGAILESNLPVQKYTFGFKHQSIVSRFVSLWSNKSGDFAKLNHFCQNGLENPSFFDISDQCLNQPGYDRLMAKTSSFEEMAFTMAEGGDLKDFHDGKYGSVSRGHAELGVGGHTHHRERGKDYRRFNVPTPEDVMTFCTHRAFAIVNSLNHARDAELVVTHNNIYELADTNDAHGIVAEMVAKFSAWTPERTTPAVLLMKMWAAVSKAFIERGVYDNKKGLDWDCLVTKHFGPDVFKEQAAQDRYINLFEQPIGVTIKQVPINEYEETCGLHVTDEQH